MQWIMSAKQELTLSIVGKVVLGKITRSDAARSLEISERTLRRYLKAYSTKGPRFVKHGNSGRAPVNKTDPTLKSEMLSLMKERYFVFNLTHALQFLRTFENLEVNRETFRRWCKDEDLVKRQKKKRSRPRIYRKPMAEEGCMVQMDGSPHRWFGGVESCLIATIDDATSDVPAAGFFHGETTLNCLTVLRNVIETKGIPEFIYVDRAGLYGGSKRQNFSQFQRVCQELNIEIIFAQSPEGKGRIERHFNTAQDRLVAELQFFNITTIEEANAYLQEKFIPDYRARFTHPAAQPTKAWRALPLELNLDEVFALKYDRSVNRDHTFSWEGSLYAFQPPAGRYLVKQYIEVRVYPDKSWKAFFGNTQLTLQKIKKSFQRVA
jgi:hypothetical protein